MASMHAIECCMVYCHTNNHNYINKILLEISLYFVLTHGEFCVELTGKLPNIGRMQFMLEFFYAPC